MVLFSLRAPDDASEPDIEQARVVDSVLETPIDEESLAAAAQEIVASTRRVAYCVAATVVLVFVVAVAFLFNASIDPWLSGGFILSVVVGMLLFGSYWSTRKRAYADALELERRRANNDDWERSGASFVTAVVALVGGLIVAVQSGAWEGAFRPGGGDRIFYILGAVALGAMMSWWLTRSYGVVRFVSLAHIVFSLVLSGYGIWAIADTPARYEVADEADAKAAALCLAPLNVRVVNGQSKTHGDDKIAFVEVDNTQLTIEQRRFLFDELRRIPQHVAAHRTADDRAVEAVYAPIDDLEKLAEQFEKYETVEIDRSRRRITLRPNIPLLEELAEVERCRHEIRSLSAALESPEEMLELIRRLNGRDHVVVVDVRPPKPGAERDDLAIYRRFKLRAPVLRIISLYDGVQQYVLKRDDVVELAEELDFGKVVDVSSASRRITIELDEKPKPVGGIPTTK